MKLVFFLLITGMVSFNPSDIQAAHDAVTTVAEADDQRGETPTLLWDGLLQAHVNRDGVVDYKAMKEDPSFERCVEAFSNMALPANWNAQQRMAYWINVYNVFTVKLILDNYPVKSINDIKDPWKKKFITLDGESYSLNQIENEILRPKFKDARIHFAVNCASFSCPKLNNRAFFGHSLDKVLSQLTRDFVNDPKRNTISASKAEVSKIFEWYAEDFTRNGQTLVSWLNRYSQVKIDESTTVTYMKYDWSLNE